MINQSKFQVFWDFVWCSGATNDVLRRMYAQHHSMAVRAAANELGDADVEFKWIVKELLRAEFRQMVEKSADRQFFPRLIEMNKAILVLKRIANHAAGYHRAPSVFLPPSKCNDYFIADAYMDLLTSHFQETANAEEFCEEMGKVLSEGYPEIPAGLLDLARTFQVFNASVTCDIVGDLCLVPLTRMFENVLCRGVLNCTSRTDDVMGLEYLYALAHQCPEVFSRTVTIRLISRLFPCLHFSGRSVTKPYMIRLLQNISDVKLLAFVFEMALVLGDDEGREYYLQVDFDLPMVHCQLPEPDHRSMKENIAYLKTFSFLYTAWMRNAGGSMFETPNGSSELRRAIHGTFCRNLEQRVNAFSIASAAHFVYPEDFPETGDDIMRSEQYCFFRWTHLLTDFQGFLARYIRVALYRILGSQAKNLHNCLLWEIRIFEAIKSELSTEHADLVDRLLSSLNALRLSVLLCQRRHHCADGCAIRHFFLDSAVWGKFLPTEPIGRSQSLHAMSAVQNQDFVSLFAGFKEKHRGEVESVCPSLCFANIDFAGTRVKVSAFDAAILRVVEKHAAVCLNEISAELRVSLDELCKSAFIANINHLNNVLEFDTSSQVRYNATFRPTAHFVESLYFHYALASRPLCDFPCRVRYNTTEKQ